MITKLDSKSEKIKLVFFSTFLFGFLAHAYCYFNLNFSHDSVMVVQFDGDWQITIGRWLQPYYCLLRGDLYNPFLVGAISLAYLACACYLILLILNVNHSFSIVFICGVLATNSMLTYANATYIYLSDIYMLAFLLAVAGVYACQNYKYGFGAAAILFALSLALYQSFLQAAILLFLFLMIKDLMENQNFVLVIKKGFGYLFTLVGGVLLYLAGDKLVLAIKNLQPVDSYNSLSNLLKLGGLRQIVQLILGAYKYFFSYCLHPLIFNSTIVAILTIGIYIYIYCTCCTMSWLRESSLQRISYV